METAARAGDWMQTYSGKVFWPMDPHPEDVDIDDIAHALSMLCRFGGHTKWFYSVAEHCCHVHDFAPRQHRGWALLHDAAEAYLVDVPRPVKHALAVYKEAEALLLGVIATKFGLRGAFPDEVKCLDNRILVDECQQAMGGPTKPWSGDEKPLGVQLQFWSPARACAEFRERFWAYWALWTHGVLEA